MVKGQKLQSKRGFMKASLNSRSVLKQSSSINNNGDRIQNRLSNNGKDKQLAETCNEGTKTVCLSGGSQYHGYTDRPLANK